MKAQRAGDARRVHQRVQGHGAGALCRPLEPERGEARKLLRPRKSRIHCQRARRQTILAGIAADGAEIGCAQEGGDVRFPVGHELHAEPRKSRLIAHDGRDRCRPCRTRTSPGRRESRALGRR